MTSFSKPPTGRRPFFAAASLAALALGHLGVLGVLGPINAASAASVKAQSKQKAQPVAFPALSVTDVKTGKAFKLTSLAASKKATLVWFWAPH